MCIRDRNWGSLDQDLLARIMDDNARRAEPSDAVAVMREAMVASALESAARAEAIGLPGDRIILSCKVSGVQDLIAIYRDLSRRCDYPLHLGLTEAGMGSKGIVASTAAMAVLLQEGIGDTIRVSLTPDPGGKRTQEVTVAQEMLQTMGLRAFTPMAVSYTHLFLQRAIKNPLYETPDRAYLNAADCYAKLGELDKAEAYAQQSLRIAPDSAQALLKLADINYRRGDLQLASEQLSDLVRRVEPVSYTHLDVYKRQVLRWLHRFGQGDFDAMTDIARSPVSYTHLAS